MHLVFLNGILTDKAVLPSGVFLLHVLPFST